MLLYIGFSVAVLLLVLMRKLLTSTRFRALLVLTKDQRVAMYLYALILFPGIVLHELSHWLSAKLLRVKTHRVSFIPRWVGEERVQLGFVETSKTDFIRTALIAIAPLISGTAVVVWIVFNKLNLCIVIEAVLVGDWELATWGLRESFVTVYVFLWLYFLFAISNTMMPSQSDWIAWIPLGIFLFIVLILLALAVQPANFLEWLQYEFRSILTALSYSFWITVILDIAISIPLWMILRHRS